MDKWKMEKSGGFNYYNKERFTRNNHFELFIFLVRAERKGVKWLLTNRDTHFIRSLHERYPYIVKDTARIINSRGDKRSKDILIWNYRR